MKLVKIDSKRIPESEPRNNVSWLSYITVGKKSMFLGTFDDYFEACCARKSAENKYFEGNRK